MCGFLSFYHSVYYFRTWYLGLSDFIFPSHGHPYLVHTRTWELCLLGSRRPCSSFHTQQFPTVNHRRVFLGLAVLAHGFRWDPSQGAVMFAVVVRLPWCCQFVISVCPQHLPSEVMKCLFLPGTCSLDEKECSRAHSSLHCFRVFISVCHPEHFFTSSWNTVISTLSLSLHPISLESPWPQIFSFNSYILADCDR